MSVEASPDGTAPIRPGQSPCSAGSATVRAAGGRLASPAHARPAATETRAAAWPGGPGRRSARPWREGDGRRRRGRRPAAPVVVPRPLGPPRGLARAAGAGRGEGRPGLPPGGRRQLPAARRGLAEHARGGPLLRGLPPAADRSRATGRSSRAGRSPSPARSCRPIRYAAADEPRLAPLIVGDRPPAAVAVRRRADPAAAALRSIGASPVRIRGRAGGRLVVGGRLGLRPGAGPGGRRGAGLAAPPRAGRRGDPASRPVRGDRPAATRVRRRTPRTEFVRHGARPMAAIHLRSDRGRD